MGLSASQGRMLLLTARKNDLEFRAQSISQQRLELSSKLEKISSDYEEATSNREMKIKLTDASAEDGSSVNKTYSLCYKALVSGTANAAKSGNELAYGIVPSATAGTEQMIEDRVTSTAAYRLVDTNGNIVVSDKSEIPGYSEENDPNDGTYTVYFKISTTESTDSSSTDETDQSTDSSSTDETDQSTGTVTTYTIVNASDGNANSQISYVIDPTLARSTENTLSGTEGENYLQDTLRNGLYTIQKVSKTENNELKWSDVSWDAATSISDEYFEGDDATAKAKYDRLQNQIESKDKKLEMELDNIETQRSAVTTETESVKTVISDNVKATFKLFA